jgi:hypothetical protein
MPAADRVIGFRGPIPSRTELRRGAGRPRVSRNAVDWEYENEWKGSLRADAAHHASQAVGYRRLVACGWAQDLEAQKRKAPAFYGNSRQTQTTVRRWSQYRMVEAIPCGPDTNCFEYTTAVHKGERAALKKQQFQWRLNQTPNPATPTNT